MMVEDFLKNAVDNQTKRITKVFSFIENEFPELHLEMKWSQPMFLLDKTFIISFNLAKKHISIAVEKVILDEYVELISESYQHSKMLFKIKNSEVVNYDLLKLLINKSIDLKKGMDRFWY